MVTYRIQGLKWRHVVAQTGLVLAIFWRWGAFPFEGRRYDSGMALERDAILSGMWVIGLLADSARSERLKLNVLQLAPGKATRIALQQSAVIIAAFLLSLGAIEDQAISRIFLFAFIPVLLLSNRFLREFLANFLFTGKRTHRTRLLVSCGNLQEEISN